MSKFIKGYTPWILCSDKTKRPKNGQSVLLRTFGGKSEDMEAIYNAESREFVNSQNSRLSIDKFTGYWKVKNV